MWLKAWLNYGIAKGLKYKINTISWFLADVSLYLSVYIMYELLSFSFETIGQYSKAEIGLYISTYFIINNLFAIFFSEMVSIYGEAILNGSYSYYQLLPIGVLKSLFLLNFNFPALLSTPFLLALNIFYVKQFSVTVITGTLYYLSCIFAVDIMLFFFLSLYTFLLLGIRTGALSSAVSQLFSLAEKPDKVFKVYVRKIFTFCIPAFMFSAVPARVILGQQDIWETIYIFICPFVLYMLYCIIERIGAKRYRCSGG